MSTETTTCACPDREVGVHMPSCPRVEPTVRELARIAGLVIADLMSSGTPIVIWRTHIQDRNDAAFPPLEGQVDHREDGHAVLAAYAERWDAPITNYFDDDTTLQVCARLRGIHVRIWAHIEHPETQREGGQR